MNRSWIFVTAVCLSLIGGVARSQDLDGGFQAYLMEDYTRAMAEFMPPAEAGHPGSQYYVGLMYYDGLGVPIDRNEAGKWMRLSAEGGNNSAQYIAGYMFRYGDGLPQSDVAAAKWLTKSSDGGNRWAQYELGVMYITGEGVEKDSVEGVRLFDLSARAGIALAQHNLGATAHLGLGMLQDNITAHMWYNIASANGDERSANFRDDIAEEMSQSDISTAQAMAVKCMDSGYKDCDR